MGTIVLPIVATDPFVIMWFARFTEGERLNLRAIRHGILAVIASAESSLSLR